MKTLADYYDPKLPDSAIVTVPNELLRELKEAQSRQRRENEPPDYSITSPQTMGFLDETADSSL